MRTIKAQRGPCTPETEHCRDLRSYAKDMPECCKEHLRHVVFTFGDAMTAAGITWWLDYGSLLGAVRNPMTTWADFGWLPQHGRDGTLEAGMLPHDKDADFGFLGQDWERLLALGGGEWAHGRLNSTKDALGLHLVHRRMVGDPKRAADIYQGGDSFKAQLSATNVIHFDGFVWYDRPIVGAPDGKLHRHRYLGVDKNKGREFSPERLFPLTTVKWEGRDLPAPNDPEWFCEFRYGKNWRTPIARNNSGVRVP